MGRSTVFIQGPGEPIPRAGTTLSCPSGVDHQRNPLSLDSGHPLVTCGSQHRQSWPCCPPLTAMKTSQHWPLPQPLPMESAELLAHRNLLAFSQGGSTGDHREGLPVVCAARPGYLLLFPGMRIIFGKPLLFIVMFIKVIHMS